jgi:outer membrane lipoprotein-sorting protein
MRSPVSRVAAAVIFVVALGGVALLFHGGGATFAFGDFIAPILEAKSAKFKITTEMEVQGHATTTTSEVMMLDAARSRQETERPDKSKMVMIFDWGQGKSLTLVPATKTATVLTFANMPKDKVPKDKDPLASLRSMLLDARDKPDVNREPLGEKEIDGRRVVGFRASTRGMVVTLWGDPKTGLPVRAEMSMAVFGKAKMTMSDFVFNLDMDESLFSTEPPAGYTVQNMKIDISPGEEKDLIETFREYSKLSGGAFPDALDMQQTIQIAAKKFASEMSEKPNERQMQKMVEAQTRLQRGLTFALLLPTHADAHYAGKGISLGAADKPIFWYRAKDSKKYRVIYADLSVRDANAPPKVPNAQPVPAAAGPKK